MQSGPCSASIRFRNKKYHTKRNPVFNNKGNIMDPVVKVAAEMGPEWLYVVASILVVVVGVLGVVTWWLIKKKTGKTEKEIEGLQAEHRLFMEKLGIIAERLEARNRADDVLEKRLASGAESF